MYVTEHRKKSNRLIVNIKLERRQLILREIQK